MTRYTIHVDTDADPTAVTNVLRWAADHIIEAFGEDVGIDVPVVVEVVR